MKNIGFGIIGSGAVSKYHIQSLELAEGAHLVGIFSTDQKSAEYLANEHNVICFHSIEDMISCEDVEAVSICTPSGTHADLAERILLSKKHVLVEKPLALNTFDAQRVWLAAKKSGKICAVVSQLRFLESVKKAKDAISAGKLGKINIISAYMKYHRSAEYYSSAKWRGTWCEDGGVFMNQGIHGMDVLRYLGGEVSAVSAASRTLFHNIEADDTTAVLLEFENGAVGVAEGSTCVYPGYDLAVEVCGTRGCIRLEGSRIVKWDVQDCKEEISESENTFSSSSAPDTISYIGHKLQIENMVRAILGKERLVNDCESGYKTVELVSAVYESSKTKKRVIVN